MASIEQVLSAVIEFLNDAENLGLIKQFSLRLCDVNYAEIPGTEELMAQFYKKMNIPNMLAKNSSSDEEYVIIEDEKRSESDSVTESLVKESSEGQIVIDEASNDSFNSCITERVSEEDKKDEVISLSNSPDKVLSENLKPEDETRELESVAKKELVQINVDTNEMKRRISAFISRKRKEVDEWNVQEFCGRSYIDEQDPAWEKLDSCARVDAVFVPRRGCKSHIKISRVQNVCGPQTQWQPDMKKIKQEPGESENQPSDATLQALDERLLNMETHLKLKTDSTLRKNLFQRIKNLEDKILYIESTSPEYFHISNSDALPNRKISSEDKVYPNKVEDIQKRIETLKQSLKMKALHVRNG